MAAAGVTLKTGTAPTTPPSGYVTVFVNSADSDTPYYKDSGGTSHSLVGPTGATGATGAAATGDDANTVLGAFIFGG